MLCVDDHRIVREGIGLIIDREPDMKVVGSAATGEEAVALFARERPDVTLMDLQLPTMSGLDAIHAIRREDPDARIIVLTMYQGDEDIHRALAAGAATYLAEGHAVRRPDPDRPRGARRDGGRFAPTSRRGWTSAPPRRR